MFSAAQQQPLNLAEGLFLLKYESAEDNQHPPKITLSVASGNPGKVEFVLPPGAKDPVLWSPGASLVLRVITPSRLLVEVSAGAAGSSTAARLQSIPLSTDPAGLAKMISVTIDPSDLRLLGHLAGQGDVVIGPGEWLGGPMAPSRIEGILLEWRKRPENFNLRYSVKIGGNSPTATQPLEAGSFAGTRGRALPLVGASFEISGNAAEHYQLIVESLFLGCPLMRTAGQRIDLAGPTGREPLVGLNVRIVATGKQSTAPAAANSDQADLSKRKTGRVRIYRSKSNPSGK